MTREAGEVAAMTATPRLELAADHADELGVALADGARAQHIDGDLQASRQSFDRAYRLAADAGDVPAMALAALGLAGLWVRERRTVAGSVLLEERLAHVLARLDAGDPLALRVRARLAGEDDYARGKHAAILAVLTDARAADARAADARAADARAADARAADARAGADPVALAEALSIAHHCLLGPDHVELRGQLAVELTKVSVRTQRRGDLLMGLLWQTVDAFSAGDPHAGRLLRELRDHLCERNHLVVGFVVSAIEVMLAIRAGHLEEAESLAVSCANSGAAAGDVDNEWWSAAQLVTIRWYQGRLVELLPMLRDRAHSPVLSAVDDSATAALAVAAALDGDRRTAASLLAALCGQDLAHLPRSSSWLVTMNGIIEAACLLRDAVLAERAYELLAPYAALPMVGSLGVTCFGSVHQALGVAALTSGQLDRAVDHLRAAVQHNLALAHWPAVVASRQRLTQAYTRRRGPGDTQAARREREQATSEATALGLPTLGLPALGRPTLGPPTLGPPTLGPPTLGLPTLDPSILGPQAPEALGPGAGGRAGSTFADCRRVGRQWRLAWGARSVLVGDSIGLVHLAVLITNPRQEIPAADLVIGLAVLRRTGAAPHPVLDHEAIGEYRNRMKRLETEIDRLDAGDATDQAAQARAERDWLAAQLASAAGLGGRTRSFPDSDERARVAVGKAIRRALVRIAEADPVIGEHLHQTVRTGVRCSYWPA